jgi:hypothetical protein
MSTSALIMMIITWGYILAMVIYFFGKLVRKEREAKRRPDGRKPSGQR